MNPAACPHPAYDEDTGACVQCGAGMDDVRHHAELDAAIADHLRGPLFASAPTLPATPKATLPEWVPPATRCHGHGREDVMTMVVRACETLLGRPANPTACGTNARSVLALWKALGHPDPKALADDLVLVIGWAQRSPDKLAENDVRGVRPNGERWGPDRSRSMATLCVQERWDARLDAARQWDERGAPEAAGTAPTVPGRPDADAAWATFEAVAGNVRRGDPLPEGDTDHEREVLAVYRGSVGWRRWFERSQFTKPAIRQTFAAAWATAPNDPNPNRQEGRT